VYILYRSRAEAGGGNVYTIGRRRKRGSSVSRNTQNLSNTSCVLQLVESQHSTPKLGLEYGLFAFRALLSQTASLVIAICNTSQYLQVAIPPNRDTPFCLNECFLHHVRLTILPKHTTRIPTHLTTAFYSTVQHPELTTRSTTNILMHT